MQDILSREPGNAEPNLDYTNEDWLDEFCGPVDDELEQLREKAKAEQFRRDTMYHEEPAW